MRSLTRNNQNRILLQRTQNAANINSLHNINHWNSKQLIRSNTINNQSSVFHITRHRFSSQIESTDEISQIKINNINCTQTPSSINIGSNILNSQSKQLQSSNPIWYLNSFSKRSFGNNTSNQNTTTTTATVSDTNKQSNKKKKPKSGAFSMPPNSNSNQNHPTESSNNTSNSSQSSQSSESGGNPKTVENKISKSLKPAEKAFKSIKKKAASGVSNSSQFYSKTITKEEHIKKGESGEDIKTIQESQQVHARFSYGDTAVDWNSKQTVSTDKVDYNDSESPVKTHETIETHKIEGFRSEGPGESDIRTESQKTLQTNDVMNEDFKPKIESGSRYANHQRVILQSPNNPKIVSFLSQIEPEIDINTIDIYTIGNPTEEEIERRRLLLKSPNAIMIHPNRLLNTKIPEIMDKEFNEQRTLSGRIRTQLRQWRKVFTKRIVGDETYSKLEEKFIKKFEDFNEELETTQNPHLVALRNVIDKINKQTESSRAMEVLRDEMEDFWVEDFLPEFTENFLPDIVRAWFNEDMIYLDKICIGEASVFCKGTVDARIKENKLISNDILWIERAELVETRLAKNTKLPQLVIRTEVQTVDCVYERDSEETKIIEGSPSLVANNVFVMTLEPCMDNQYIKEIGFPWQLRTFQTAKVRQLV